MTKYTHQHINCSQSISTPSPSIPATATSLTPQDSLQARDGSSRLKPTSSTSPPPRKSPPPPKLNLDDCKTFIPAPVTSPTSNSSPNPGTAFVFTSSRTLRQSQPHPTISSNFSSPSASPSTPPLSPNSPTTQAHRSRPSLTSAQLAKHSQGAVDARCIVGPNMRAAGFVPLAHTLTPMTHSRHQSASSIVSIGDTVSPGTPGSVPTPSEPPPFPPIMFVNPSVVATTPMWEYQRALGWGGPGRQTMGLAMNPSDSSVPITIGTSFIPATTSSSRPNPHHTTSSSTVATIASTATSASGAFSSSGSSSWSSVPSLRTRALEKVGGNTSEYRYSTPPVDGYPFPHTPPRSQSDSPLSRGESARSSGYSSERESSVTTSRISSTESTASNCTIPTPNPSFSMSTTTPPSFSTHIRRSSTVPASQTRPKPTPVQSSTKYKPDVDTPRFATARKRGTRSAARIHELSLTELCDNSPSAWATDPNCLGPLSSPSSSGLPGSSSGSSSVDDGRVSQGRSRAGSANTDTGSQRRGRERGRNEDMARIRPKHRPLPAAEVESLSSQQEEESTEIAIAELRASPESWDPVKEGDESGASDKPSIEGDRPRGKAKAKERERQSSSSSRHSHGHGGHKGYSSFSFPPTSSPESKTAPHVLGEREKVHSSSKETKSNSKERREHNREHREKEHHHRDKELGALVQAHRDRDREQARQSERERRDALGHAKEKAIAIDSEVNTEAETDVVQDLDQDWDRLHRKRVGRGRGLYYGSGTGRSRGGRSIFGGSDAETVVDIF